MSVSCIIFTDMDGSLLDHETYSHAEADDCLGWLRNKQIPIVPCTSKTRAEMEVMRTELNNKDPFIIENGAAVCIPKDYFQSNNDNLDELNGLLIKSFSPARAHWQTILDNTPTHLNDAFITFHQAGVKGVMQMTGLTINEARLASQREFGEPLKWLGNEHQFEQFEAYIESQHGTLLKGGRFVHLSGDCDKGRALNWMMMQFKQQHPDSNCISIALGDSQNDVAMLSAADYAVMIKSPVHDFPQMQGRIGKHLYRTQAEGPLGWVEGIHNVFAQLNIDI